MKHSKLIAVLTVAALTAVGTACSRDKSNPVSESDKKPSVKETLTKEQLEIATTLKSMYAKIYPESDCSKEEMETGRAALNLKNRFEAADDAKEISSNLKGMVTHLSKNPNVFCKVNIIGEIAKYGVDNYVESKKTDFSKAGAIADGLSDIFEESTHQIAAVANDKKPFAEHGEVYGKTVSSVVKNLDIANKNSEIIRGFYNEDNTKNSELVQSAANFNVIHRDFLQNVPAKMGQLEPDPNDEQEDAVMKIKYLNELDSKLSAIADMGGRFIKLLNEEKQESTKVAEGTTPNTTGEVL